MHILVGYIFLNNDEQIVVQNPKSKIFFYYMEFVVLFVVCEFTIYIFVKVAKLHLVASWLPRREDCILQVSFDAQYLFV